jgi:hypothetical protein
LTFGVHAGTTSGCGQGFDETFSPGSAINYTAVVPKSPPGYGFTCSGAGSTFTMQS